MIRFCLTLIYLMSAQKLFQKQIDVFLSWTNRNHTGSTSYEEWLDRFLKWSNKEDILDVSNEDVDLFLQIVDNEENATYRKMEARRAINAFRRYYMARSKNGKIRMGRGRPPAIDQYNRVGELRDKLGDKITFKEIGILLNPKKPVDRSLVWHWYDRFLKLKARK